MVISLFIIMVLMVIGFYSFNQLDRNTYLQKSAEEIAGAIETARGYSMSLPSIIPNPEIKDITYTGIKFNKNSDDDSALSYEYFYTKCDDLDSFNPDSLSTDDDCLKDSIIRIGDDQTFSKNIFIRDDNSSDPDLPDYPILLFNKNKIVFWCNNDGSCNSNKLDLSGLAPAYEKTIWLTKRLSTTEGKAIIINVNSGIPSVE
jgi:hypothetical protein